MQCNIGRSHWDTAVGRYLPLTQDVVDYGSCFARRGSKRKLVA